MSIPRSSVSRRELAGLALLLPWLPRLLQERRVTTTADGEPELVAPPGEPAREFRARIESLERELAASRTTTSDVLADPANDALRPYPAFRAAIERHARAARTVLVPRGEPGVPLTATVRVLDREGRPYPDVRIYAYQTSARGWYAAEAPHVSGNSGDFRFARLFAYARTDADGRCELVTVRPGPYPRSGLPSHVHLQLEGRGQDLRTTEIRFEDCPHVDAAARAESERAGFAVVAVERGDGGDARCTAEFRLPR
jgi:protocatechuate 3,4-dioxygenase beta subunit